MYARMSKTMRTFVDLVIFPLALFSDLGPFGQLMIYQQLGNLMLFHMYQYKMLLQGFGFENGRRVILHSGSP